MIPWRESPWSMMPGVVCESVCAGGCGVHRKVRGQVGVGVGVEVRQRRWRFLAPARQIGAHQRRMAHELAQGVDRCSGQGPLIALVHHATITTTLLHYTTKLQPHQPQMVDELAQRVDAFEDQRCTTKTTKLLKMQPHQRRMVDKLAQRVDALENHRLLPSVEQGARGLRGEELLVHLDLWKILAGGDKRKGDTAEGMVSQIPRGGAVSFRRSCVKNWI